MSNAPGDDRPDWADRPEREYVERADRYLEEPVPGTAPSGDTVRADRRDARAEPGPDRPPTPSEEAAADEEELAPDVAEAYKESIERGAHVKGEGRI